MIGVFGFLDWCFFLSACCLRFRFMPSWAVSILWVPIYKLTLPNQLPDLTFHQAPACAPHLKAIVLPTTSKPPTPTISSTWKELNSHLPAQLFYLTNSSALELGGTPSLHLLGASPFLCDPTTNVSPPLCLSSPFHSLGNSYRPSSVFPFSNIYGTHLTLPVFQRLNFCRSKGLIITILK